LVALSVITTLALKNPEEWAAKLNQMGLEAVTADVRLFLKEMARADPAQFVIPFEEFQSAPPLINVGERLVASIKSTPAEGRIYLKWQDARLAGMQKRIREEVAATRKFKEMLRAATPFCIGPVKTIEDGLREREKHMQKPAVLNKKKGGKARWGLT
jgi:hypothetical protein